MRRLGQKMRVTVVDIDVVKPIHAYGVDSMVVMKFTSE